MQKYYYYIIKTCVDETKDKLFLEYIFKFDKSLVDQYFIKLSKKYNIKIKIKNYKEKNYKKLINEYITN